MKKEGKFRVRSREWSPKLKSTEEKEGDKYSASKVVEAIQNYKMKDMEVNEKKRILSA